MIEVTLTVPDAMSLAAEFRLSENGILVGLGTVRTADEAEQAVASGADFVVSPVSSMEVAAVCRAANVPFILGATTPTEIWQCWNAGSTAVKVFPARELGGRGYIKAVKSVMPEIPLMPTGGVSIESAKSYLDAGAVCVGLGSELLPPSFLEANDPTKVLGMLEQLQKICGIEYPDVLDSVAKRYK